MVGKGEVFPLHSGHILTGEGCFLRERNRAVLALLLTVLLALLLPLPRWGRTAETFTRLPDQTLILDPGHGGEDGGAVSVSGAPESRINLTIAMQTDQLMGFFGVRTVLTRTGDLSIHDTEAETLREKKVSDLHNRVALINGTENATLISIHQNSAPDERIHGAQVFFGDEILSRPLAQTIQEAIRETLDPENHRRPQQAASSIYLMNHISCRAVLVECGFLSNPEEEQRLRDPAYQKKLAMVLAAGYLTSGDTQEGESLI